MQLKDIRDAKLQVVLASAEDCLNNSFQKLLKQKNKLSHSTIDLPAFEFIESDPVSLLAAEEFGDFAGNFEICLILSLSLSRTGPGDVSTCKLPVCYLKPDLTKSIGVLLITAILIFLGACSTNTIRGFFFAFST